MTSQEYTSFYTNYYFYFLIFVPTFHFSTPTLKITNVVINLKLILVISCTHTYTLSKLSVNNSLVRFTV